MTTIKTITLVMIIQLIAMNAIAIKTIDRSEINFTLGDGKDKYNPKKIHGESLKGYFYRIYGDKALPAKQIQFKEPFKLKKIKKFLQYCQDTVHGGQIVEKSNVITHAEKIKLEDGISVGHITLLTTVACINSNNNFVNDISWASVYVDTDNKGNEPNYHKFNISYTDCESDYVNLHLYKNDYSIHYDESFKCHADLSEISD